MASRFSALALPLACDVPDPDLLSVPGTSCALLCSLVSALSVSGLPSSTICSWKTPTETSESKDNQVRPPGAQCGQRTCT